MQTYKLLEQDSVLLSQPLLIQHFGRAGAQFLSQLHYWLEKKDNLGCKYQGTHWIYNSAESWAEQIQLSVSQFKRIIKKLSSLGIINIQKLNPHKSVRTNYYSIDYDKLSASISSKNTIETHTFVHSAIMSQSLCHSDMIYNDTKTTNKDINKSEDLPTEQVGQGETKRKQVEPVNQVKNIIPKNQERKLVKSDKTSITDNSNHVRSTGKTSTAQDMLTIWNETLGDKAKALMSKDLAPLLVSSYSKKFEQSLEQWKTYCELIKSSQYLTSEQFQLSIFWALKFSTIDRIRAGEFGVKSAVPNHVKGQGDSQSVNEIQVQQMIEDLEESVQAKVLRLKIVKAIGAGAYHSWFHQARFETIEGEIQLIAPNSFVEQYWDTHYSWVRKSW